MKELNQLDRVHLVLALQAAVDREALHRRGTAWVEDNIRHIDSHNVGSATTPALTKCALG